MALRRTNLLAATSWQSLRQMFAEDAAKKAVRTPPLATSKEKKERAIVKEAKKAVDSTPSVTSSNKENETVFVEDATKAVDPTQSVASPKKKKKERLYRRLSALGVTGESVSKTLNDAVMEGMRATKSELNSCVKELRKYRKFNHALEILEWMEKRKYMLTQADHAIHLDLIAKTKGVVAAEGFFDGLSPANKTRLTYGALLNCYCKQLMTDKALDLYKKMDEIGYLVGALPYNNIMSLYMRLGQPEKVSSIALEMKERNIAPDTTTYNLRLQSYGGLNDIEGVEAVMKEMEEKDKTLCDWTTHTNLATIYLKAGLVEKAELALKKAEATMGPESRDREAYHYLISLYASASNLLEVNRLWESLKSNFKTITNMSYLIMLQALAKLKDVEGLTSCFKEWESSYAAYDMRLTKVVIRSYLEHDMYEEARSVFDDALKRSTLSMFQFNARELFMEYFLRKNQLGSALEHLRAAFSEAKEKWKPSDRMITTFFNHFIEDKDVDGSERFCKVLKQIDRLDAAAYKLLINTYISASKSAPEMRQRLKEDNIEINEELEDLLEKVSPE